MGAVIWAGTIAGALLAIGTLLRCIVVRAARAAAWTTAVVALPAQVDRLTVAVDHLTESVDRLQLVHLDHHTATR